MARIDLDGLRLEIAALAEESGAPLSESEFDALRYYGAVALRDTAEFYESIIAVEYDATPLPDDDDELTDDERHIRPHDDYDDGDQWDIEIFFPYDES